MRRRGLDGRGGLDRLAERLRKLRAAARRRGDLGGTLDQIRAALDQALAAEREALAGADDDGARLAEMELDTLPDDVAGAVRGLADYQWRSPEARATYESIKQMLQREVLDAQFAGMKQALESPDPEAMQRVKDMLADLNALLAAHARNEDTTEQFADFMAKHGEFFPEQPENVEELIDALARRQAAAQRMMASLSPGAARPARPADAAGAERRRPGLGDGAARPTTCAPSVLGWTGSHRAGCGPAGNPSGTARRSRRSPSWPTWRRCRTSCPRTDPGSTLDDVDVEMLERRLGGDAVADLQALRDLERELEQQGFLTRTDDGLRLTPRAVRRLGQTALKRVFAQLEASGAGDHDDHRTGAADEPHRAVPAVGVRRRVADRRPAYGRERTPPGMRRTLRRARAPAGWRVGSSPRSARGRGLRGDRDRAADLGGGGALRRPVVLDGGRRPLGTDEADRAGAAAPDRDPLPAGRAAGDRVQPVGPAAVARAAGRGRAGVDPGHQPAARADAGGAASAASSRRRAGRAGGHRRRADRPPAERRGRVLLLAEHLRRPSGPPWRRSTS